MWPELTTFRSFPWATTALMRSDTFHLPSERNPRLSAQTVITSTGPESSSPARISGTHKAREFTARSTRTIKTSAGHFNSWTSVRIQRLKELESMFLRSLLPWEAVVTERSSQAMSCAPLCFLSTRRVCEVFSKTHSHLAQEKKKKWRLSETGGFGVFRKKSSVFYRTSMTSLCLYTLLSVHTHTIKNIKKKKIKIFNLLKRWNKE